MQVWSLYNFFNELTSLFVEREKMSINKERSSKKSEKQFSLSQHLKLLNPIIRQILITYRDKNS